MSAADAVSRSVIDWLRPQDLPAAVVSDAPLALDSLAGVWVGADRHSMSVDSLDVGQRDGVTVLRATGGDQMGARNWGDVAAATYAFDVAGTAALGLTATVDFGFLETTLTGFTKSGIFIVCTYNRWKDGSGRADYFTREFLYRRFRQGGRPPAVGLVSGGVTRGLDRRAGDPGTVVTPAPTAEVDPSPVVGRFVSCDRSTAGFVEVSVAPVGRRLELTLGAADHPQFGAGRRVLMQGTAFGERVEGGPAAGLLAESASPFQRLVLAAYLNKGLLAIDTYATFTDGSGRHPYRSRDHFFRADRPTRA